LEIQIENIARSITLIGSDSFNLNAICMDGDMNPLFSVVVPVHNKRPHLERCISSILRQDFSNFEILIVDDISSDGSAEIIDGFLDVRVRKFKRVVPGPGGYAARNLAIENSHGQWIAFLDADDEWLPNHLSNIKRSIDSHRDARLIATGWINKFPDGGEEVDLYSKIKGQGQVSQTFDLDDYIKGPRPIWTGALAIKKDFLDCVGGFNEEWRHGADLELWLRLMLKKSSATAIKIFEPTSVYHRDSVNMVTSNLSQYFSPSSVYILEVLQSGLEGANECTLRKLSAYANKSAISPFLRHLEKRHIDKKIYAQSFSEKYPTDKYVYLFKVMEVMPFWLRRIAVKYIRIFMNKR